jgi:hypothetical protein
VKWPDRDSYNQHHESTVDELFHLVGHLVLTLFYGRTRASTERKHLLDGQFKIVRKAEGMPANLKQAFSKVTREPSFEMADPGQKFQVTDVMLGQALPFRRLVFAGTQDNTWFVHYERGGYAHSYYVNAFKVNPHGDANFIWGCPVAGVAKSLEELRTMVAACQLAKADSYW